jgi:hypothetical protein
MRPKFFCINIDRSISKSKSILTNFKERRKSDAKGRKILMKSVVPAKPEKEVDCVLADAGHRSLKLVQDIPQLHNILHNIKTNSPMIENPIKELASIDDQCIQAVRRLKKRYQELFVIGEDEMKPRKGKPAMLEAVQWAHVWLVSPWLSTKMSKGSSRFLSNISTL